MERQKVYPSRTIAGNPGLFTGWLMACPLTEEEFSDLSKIKAKCKRMNFELVSRGEGIKNV